MIWSLQLPIISLQASCISTATALSLQAEEDIKPSLTQKFPATMIQSYFFAK